nr:MAG TPA: hypothetical protein [Caudoviricetes sp.]
MEGSLISCLPYPFIISHPYALLKFSYFVFCKVI